MKIWAKRYIALTFILGTLTLMAGCSDPTSEEDQGFFSVNGPVLIITDNNDFSIVSPYVGETLNVRNTNFRIGGSGVIENGHLSYQPIVHSYYLERFELILLSGNPRNFASFFDDLKISPGDTPGIALNLVVGGDSLVLMKRFQTDNMSGVVDYIYVDNDCILTAKGKTSMYNGYSRVSSDIHWELEKGWNVFHYIMTYIGPMQVKVDSYLGDNALCNWTIYPRR